MSLKHCTVAGYETSTAVGYVPLATEEEGGTAVGYIPLTAEEEGSTVVGYIPLATEEESSTAVGYIPLATEEEGSTAVGYIPLATEEEGSTAVGYIPLTTEEEGMNTQCSGDAAYECACGQLASSGTWSWCSLMPRPLNGVWALRLVWVPTHEVHLKSSTSHEWVM